MRVIIRFFRLDTEFPIVNSKKRRIDNIELTRYESNLQSAKDTFTFITTNKSPYFVIFDNKNIVLKTHSPNEALKFLEKHR